MKFKLLPLFTLAGALLGSVAASATTIDFSAAVFPNGAVLTPGDYVLTGVYEPLQASGFDFWTVSDGDQGAVVSGTMSGLFYVPSGHDLFSAFLHPNGGGHFAPLGGGSFTLNSLEMNWWDFVWDSVYHPYSVTGTFADGTTRTVYGTVDPGQFHTLTLNWSNLSSVSFTGNAGPAWDGGGFVGISNVVVNASPVPEPAGSLLWLAGLAAVGTVARRRIRA
jgi:hypothetical protein